MAPQANLRRSWPTRATLCAHVGHVARGRGLTTAGRGDCGGAWPADSGPGGSSLPWPRRSNLTATRPSSSATPVTEASFSLVNLQTKQSQPHANVRQ
jgi:hypothetical protein